jgi:hypothetical protein
MSMKVVTGTLPDQAPDLMPQAPRQPQDGECCSSGCTYCVMDLYTEDLHRYRAELAQWQLRQSAATDTDSAAAG